MPFVAHWPAPVDSRSLGSVTQHREVAIVLEELCQTLRRGDGALRGLTHAFQEEDDPGLSITVAADGVELGIVGRPILLQIETQVEERLAQDGRVTEQEGDQQPTHAAVAVEKGVDGLERPVLPRLTASPCTPSAEQS